MIDNAIGAKKTEITGIGLKLIAVLAMLIDHSAAILIEPRLYGLKGNILDWPTEMIVLFAVNYLLRLVGRIGFPLFAFLIVEGFLHTRSVEKYGLNLLLFAFISEIPFDLANAHRMVYSKYQNVFFTLLCGLICIWLIDELTNKREWLNRMEPLYYAVAVAFGIFAAYELVWQCAPYEEIKKRIGNYIYLSLAAGALIGLFIYLVRIRNYDTAKKNRIVLILLPLIAMSIAADILRSDYGGMGVVTITVMYFFRSDRLKAFILGCTVLIVMSTMEWPALLMTIPVSRYNGKRGARINKYVFYAVYPVHLFILYVVAMGLGVRSLMH